MKTKNEVQKIEMPEVKSFGYTQTMYAKPLIAGTYSATVLSKPETIPELIDKNGKIRPISGQHSVKMQFNDVVNGGNVTRSVTLEGLKFKHEEAVQNGAISETKSFYIVEDGKNYLNDALVYVSDGRDFEIK